MDKTLGIKLESVQKFTQDGKRLPVTLVKFEGTTDLKPGDMVKVTGISKGKGFAGVVKRWGFAGGPKTHGQSDRLRAPGSIGQTTTPGRVHRGKKMPGRLGHQKVTLMGLVVVDIDEKEKILFIKGLIPGERNGKIVIAKTGDDKKFVPLMKVGQTEIKETEEEKEERLRKEKEAEEKLQEADQAKQEQKEGQVDNAQEKKVEPEINKTDNQEKEEKKEENNA